MKSKKTVARVLRGNRASLEAATETREHSFTKKRSPKNDQKSIREKIPTCGHFFFRVSGGGPATASTKQGNPASSFAQRWVCIPISGLLKPVRPTGSTPMFCKERLIFHNDSKTTSLSLHHFQFLTETFGFGMLENLLQVVSRKRFFTRFVW